MCVLANLEYLSILFCAVFWAAAPSLVAVLPMWDTAYVSGTVTSQAIGFPLAHGRRVVPSGCLLSSHIRLIGCLTAGIWARLIALQRMSFKWLWRCCLGALLRQNSPCSPHASTALPHTQVCGSQALEPNLWATATLTASSDSLSPTAVIGGACNQSPECGEAAARSLALSTSDGALERIGLLSLIHCL